MVTNREKWIEFMELAKTLDVSVEEVLTSDGMGFMFSVNEHDNFELFKDERSSTIRLTCFGPAMVGLVSVFSSQLPELFDFWDCMIPQYIKDYNIYGIEIVEKFIERNK